MRRNTLETELYALNWLVSITAEDEPATPSFPDKNNDHQKGGQ